jgi:hypothetical protein
MASRGITNLTAIVGDSVSDLPTTPTEECFFFPLDSNLPQVYLNGSWRGLLPTTTSVANLTALKAIGASSRYAGLVVLVLSTQQRYYFNASSVLPGDDVLVAAPSAGTGRWLLLPGSVDLALPFTFSTADAAILLTIPTGGRFYLRNAYWEILSAMTGASGGAAAIGLSSSTGALTTKGDILGGASGDLLATLITGVTAGTIGVGIDTVAELHTKALLLPGSTFRFDRIANQFTAGSGNIHVTGDLLLNAGA